MPHVDCFSLMPSVRDGSMVFQKKVCRLRIAISSLLFALQNNWLQIFYQLENYAGFNHLLLSEGGKQYMLHRQSVADLLHDQTRLVQTTQHMENPFLPVSVHYNSVQPGLRLLLAFLAVGAAAQEFSMAQTIFTCVEQTFSASSYD